MKRLVSFLFLAIVISGCLGPPWISPQNTHFENELFSIDYPSNWNFRPNTEKPTYAQQFYAIKVFEGDFGDRFYKRYNVKVSVVEKGKDLFKDYVAGISLSEGAERFWQTLENAYAKEGFLVSRNPSNLSDMVFNGIEAKFISLNIRDDSKKIAFDSNCVYFHFAKREYQISYAFYDNFNAFTKARVESVVYSLKPKEKPDSN